jgi:putative transposase
VRDECLNEHWFTSLAEAQAILADWQHDYNTIRPHSSLNYRTPHEAARGAARGGLRLAFEGHAARPLPQGKSAANMTK